MAIGAILEFAAIWRVGTELRVMNERQAEMNARYLGLDQPADGDSIEEPQPEFERREPYIRWPDEIIEPDRYDGFAGAMDRIAIRSRTPLAISDRSRGPMLIALRPRPEDRPPWLAQLWRWVRA